MQIIPIHYKVSAKVRKYSQIAEDAQLMAEMLDAKDFKGVHSAGYALAHAQVSEEPLSFFVLDQSIVDKYGFEDRVIINPVILNAPIYTEKKSIPDMLKRPNYLAYDEGCLSFPHRWGKRLNRFNLIKATYQVKGGLFGLKRRTKWLEGLPSQVFQHEYDHCLGRNIYFNSK
jgi:peptide deformylase